MIDDTFLRQIATLQANLSMLESRSDELSDLADMKELRLYKAHLTDYIEAHASTGHLPRDPFQAIEQRLRTVSEFFTAADKEYQRLSGWKADWLKSVPAVSLADLLSVRAKLDELVTKVPQIQARLGQSVSSLDWGDSLDLHAELLACAQCVSGLKLPPEADRRRSLYQFTRGEGAYAMKTAAHFTTMGLRIEELIALHAVHLKALADTEHHLSYDAFRSAETSFQRLGKDRFSDVDYTLVESRLAKVLGVFAQFTGLDSSLDQRLEKKEYKAVDAQLNQLRGLTGKPDSELARESLALLLHMESRVTAALEARKKRRMKNFTVVSLLLLGVTGFTYTLISENAKVERQAAEAKVKAEMEAAVTKLKAELEVAKAQAKAEREAAEAKAEREAAEAKAKREAAEVKAQREAAEAKAEREAAEAKAKLTAEITAGRIGNTAAIPLQGKVVISFSFCPGGSFTMGSLASEEGHSSDESKVRVKLTKGFWMAKTELTQAQWQAVMGGNPSLSILSGENLPVEKVSWDAAQEFIKKVNGSGVMPDGWKMALPTEAQWEYACRAGKPGAYLGDSIDQVAWYRKKSSANLDEVWTKNTPRVSIPTPWARIHTVGMKKPNAWELYDMHGNVWEWCADWYLKHLQGGTDPSGPSAGVRRVIRGGSWFVTASDCRVVYRDQFLPDLGLDGIGFRPALVPFK